MKDIIKICKIHEYSRSLNMILGPIGKLKKSEPRKFEVLGNNKRRQEVFKLPKYSLKFKEKLDLSEKIKELTVYDRYGDMFPLTKKRNKNPI